MGVQYKVSSAQDQQFETGISATRRVDVMRALVERVDKEGMRMVPSLAKEMAKEGWQGELESFRQQVAGHVAEQSLKCSAEALVSCFVYAQEFARCHPELEADMAEMLGSVFDELKVNPRMAINTYKGRYYHPGYSLRER